MASETLAQVRRERRKPACAAERFVGAELALSFCAPLRGDLTASPSPCRRRFCVASVSRTAFLVFTLRTPRLADGVFYAGGADSAGFGDVLRDLSEERVFVRERDDVAESAQEVERQRLTVNVAAKVEEMRLDF